MNEQEEVIEFTYCCPNFLKLQRNANVPRESIFEMARAAFAPIKVDIKRYGGQIHKTPTIKLTPRLRSIKYERFIN